MGEPEKTYYDLLGVPRSATTDEIRDAYRDIARIFHPDSKFYSELVELPTTKQRLETFQLITNAYNTLSNAERRADYDAALPPELREWHDDLDDDVAISKKLEELGLKDEVSKILNLKEDPKVKGAKKAPEYHSADDRMQRLYRMAQEMQNQQAAPQPKKAPVQQSGRSTAKAPAVKAASTRTSGLKGPANRALVKQLAIAVVFAILGAVLFTLLLNALS